MAYYFRYTIPPTLAAAAGRRVLKLSLRTGYLRTARMRAASMLAGLQVIMPSLLVTKTEGCPVDDVRDKLEALLKEMNERWSYHHLSRPCALEEDRLEEEDETISLVRSDCMEALQTGNWRRWLGAAQQFVAEHGLAIEEGAGDFRELCYELGKLEARSLGVALAALRGEMDTQPAPSQHGKYASLPLAPRLEGDAAMLLSEVYEKFCTHKTNQKAWKRPDVSRAHDYDPIIPPFIALIGDKPLGSLTLADVRKFVDETMKGVGRKIGTKKRDLDRVKAFLNYAHKHLGGPAVTGPLSLEMSYNEIHDSYEPFSPVELERLFNSTEYMANTFKKASQFWLPLLGLYTGARIDEPASMLLKEIVQEGHIWAFYMSGDEANGGGKNAYAPRWLPIHPVLMDLGFTEYVQMLKDEGHERLFPDIGAAARDGYGKRATTDFTAYRRGVNVGGDSLNPDTEKWEGDNTKVFHSFRSTVSTGLSYAGVDGETARRLVGHEAKDVHGRVYLKHLDQRWLVPALAALSKLDYGLSHPKFADTEAYRKARKRIRRVPAGAAAA